MVGAELAARARPVVLCHADGVDEGVPLFKFPGLDRQHTFEVPNGTVVAWHGDHQDDFLRVSLNKLEGFVEGRHVILNSYKVIAQHPDGHSPVPFRAWNSFSSPLGSIVNGTVLRCIGRENEWLRVTYLGEVGVVLAQHVQTTRSQPGTTATSGSFVARCAAPLSPRTAGLTALGTTSSDGVDSGGGGWSSRRSPLAARPVGCAAGKPLAEHSSSTSATGVPSSSSTGSLGPGYTPWSPPPSFSWNSLEVDGSSPAAQHWDYPADAAQPALRWQQQRSPQNDTASPVGAGLSWSSWQPSASDADGVEPLIHRDPPARSSQEPSWSPMVAAANPDAAAAHFAPRARWSPVRAALPADEVQGQQRAECQWSPERSGAASYASPARWSPALQRTSPDSAQHHPGAAPPRTPLEELFEAAAEAEQEELAWTGSTLSMRPNAATDEGHAEHWQPQSDTFREILDEYLNPPGSSDVPVYRGVNL